MEKIEQFGKSSRINKANRILSLVVVVNDCVESLDGLTLAKVVPIKNEVKSWIINHAEAKEGIKLSASEVDTALGMFESFTGFLLDYAQTSQTEAHSIKFVRPAYRKPKVVRQALATLLMRELVQLL